MSDKEFALECMRVYQLDFVDQVNVPANVPYVFIELSPGLTAVLPAHLAVMKVLRSALSVEQVITKFEEEVVEHLTRASDLAQEQLRSAKWQMRRQG